MLTSSVDLLLLAMTLICSRAVNMQCHLNGPCYGRGLNHFGFGAIKKGQHGVAMLDSSVPTALASAT